MTKKSLFKRKKKLPLAHNRVHSLEEFSFYLAGRLQVPRVGSLIIYLDRVEAQFPKLTRGSRGVSVASDMPGQRALRGLFVVKSENGRAFLSACN